MAARRAAKSNNGDETIVRLLEENNDIVRQILRDTNSINDRLRKLLINTSGS